MKKNLLALIPLCLLLLPTLCLVGCGSKADEDTAPKTPPKYTPDPSKPASDTNPGGGQAESAK